MMTVASWVAPLFGVAKSDQTLDPISTLCMLALRTCKCYEHAKPAVNGNWFYFDADGYGQGLKRGATCVSNDDLWYLEPTFTFFARGWKPHQSPQLVEIVRVALQGLEIMRTEYDEKRLNATYTCKDNIQFLDRWIKTPAPLPLVVDPQQDPRAVLANLAGLHVTQLKAQKGQLHQISVQMIERLMQQMALEPPKPLEPVVELTHEELARIAKINALWPADQLASFTTHLKNKDVSGTSDILRSILEKQRVSYLEALQTKVK